MMTFLLGASVESRYGHENTGEPRATETGMRGSAGGRGKRTAHTAPRLRPTRLCGVSSYGRGCEKGPNSARNMVNGHRTGIETEQDENHSHATRIPRHERI